jgi:putative membrane protein
MSHSHSEFDPTRIDRPHSNLMIYYAICTALAGPFFFIPLIPLAIRYKTLRYTCDAEGVSMKRGLFFRREVYLTYRRIQDIHVNRNILQRWLGLATVDIQTAAGSAAAEVTIEGILEADQLRDYLYTKMRGAKGMDAGTKPVPTEAAERPAAPSGEAVAILREIRDALRIIADRQVPP